RSEWLARLAEAEARCAVALDQRAAAEARARRAADEVPRALANPKSDEERRRLEGRGAALQRELEGTGAELGRAKARRQGVEAKAEASPAIAEAQILMRRLDPRARAATLVRCQELLAKAEQQMGQENYGAAVFFALRAQDVANRGQ